MSNPWEDAEHFQNIVVKPLIAQVEASIRAELGPIVSAQADVKKRQDATDARVATLESGHKKALIGYGVYATVAAAAIGSGLSWAKKRLGLG